MPTPPKFSVILPAYNEEKALGDVLRGLCGALDPAQYEIIVVDDGCTDRTAEIVQQFTEVKLRKHRINKGYGAAIATGVHAAEGDYIIWFDSDGQHRVEDLVKIASALEQDNLDYCVGIRDSQSHQASNRMFGKFILKLTVWIVLGKTVKDFNSGLRGFRRDVLYPYLPFLPQGFGASTTTTLLMHKRGYYGKEVPITVRARVGKSSVNALKDGLRTLQIILRFFLLFTPMRFFGGIGIAVILAGLIYGLYEAFTKHQGIPVLAAVLILLGVQSFFFGLICDQISLSRLDNLERDLRK
jgi:glycosyltransferase involved in cell wall biosynthesis